MRAATRERLEGLTALHRLTSAEQREAAWRRGMATLARAVVDERRPVPLEGLDPDALLRSLEVAVEAGLVERLDWLSGPAAAAALYEGHRIYHLRAAPWLYDLEAELLRFPNAKHDDMADVISYGVRVYMATLCSGKTGRGSRGIRAGGRF